MVAATVADRATTIVLKAVQCFSNKFEGSMDIEL
jgi:hypothetical protein